MAVTHDFAAARREALTSFPQYFQMMQQMGAPYMPDFTRAGVTGGMGMAQDYRAALGRIGGAGTGMGAVAGSMSSTLASSLSAQLRMKFFEMLQQGAMNLQQGAFGAGQGGKSANPYLAAALGGGLSAATQFIPKPKGA